MAEILSPFIYLVFLAVGLAIGWRLGNRQVGLLNETVNGKNEELRRIAQTLEETRLQLEETRNQFEAEAEQPIEFEQILAQKDAQIGNLENNIYVLRQRLKEKERDFLHKEQDFLQIAAMTAGQVPFANRLHETEARIGQVQLRLSDEREARVKAETELSRLLGNREPQEISSEDDSPQTVEAQDEPPQSGESSEPVENAESETSTQTSFG